MNKKILILIIILCIIFVSGCSRSSQKVAYNLDYKAEEFELTRRIVAINGITDSPIFEIIGQCSIETDTSYVSGTMEVICEIDKDEYVKQFIYLSDNVLIVVEQLESVDVPRYHYQINFAPQSILPIPKLTYGALGD